MTQFRITRATGVTPEVAARRVADAGIVASLFVAPLWFGGRHDLGYLLYAAAVAVAAIGAAAHAAIAGSAPRISRAAVALLAGAVGLLVLQSAPLPPEAHAWLAPYADRVLPLWTGDGASLGEWRTLSVTPAETREGLALLTCHALLLVAVATRLRSTDDVRRLLGWIGYAGAAMAALALAQYGLSNGKLLWLFSHPHLAMGDAVQGVFTNKNHFAHLMALALGPLLLLVVSRGRDDDRKSAKGRRGAIGVALLSLVLIAGLASQSRGGAVALGAAAVVGTLAAWRCGALSRSRVFAAVFATLAVLSGVSMLGYDSVAERLDDLVTGDADTLDTAGARRAIWAANVAALRASPFVGFGAGAHRDYYPMFLKGSYHREFTHAESGYLQIAGETGLAGLLLLTLGVGLLAWWTLAGVFGDHDRDRRLLWVGVAPGFVASLAHSAVDFVWYTPGLMAVVVALAACAMRLHALGRGEVVTRESADRQSAEIGALPLVRVAVATTLSCLAIGTLAPSARGALDWDHYLRVSKGLRGIMQRLANDPAAADSTLAQTMAANTEYSTELLSRVVEADPGNARAHLRLAGRLLQRFELESSHCENGMSVDLIRGAATGGGFATHGAMLAWLDRAFGERATLLRLAHAHARRAVELAPMQGEGYLYLAELSFLAPGGPDRTDLVGQALAVRPHDGEVLFEAGRQRHLVGDAEAAVDLWRSSACRPGSHQLKLVMLLAGGVSASDFVETLEPNHAVLCCALRAYGEVGDEADLAALADYACELAQAEEESSVAEARRLASRWTLASRAQRAAGRHDAAVEAAQRAAMLAPHLFDARHELAHVLRAAERFDEADPHIRWCLARRPDIRYLHGWLADSAKRRTQVDRNRRSRVRPYAELAARPDAASTTEDESESAESPPGRR